MFLFVDMEERDFIFVDPFGAGESDLQMSFRNWLKYVNSRKDLLISHQQQPFKQRVLQHPRQVDSNNCGVIVCKLLSLMLSDEPVDAESFDPATISEFRASIIDAL